MLMYIYTFVSLLPILFVSPCKTNAPKRGVEGTNGGTDGKLHLLISYSTFTFDKHIQIIICLLRLPIESASGCFYSTAMVSTA